MTRKIDMQLEGGSSRRIYELKEKFSTTQNRARDPAKSGGQSTSSTPQIVCARHVRDLLLNAPDTWTTQVINAIV